jgi:hypothetical protein
MLQYCFNKAGISGICVIKRKNVTELPPLSRLGIAVFFGKQTFCFYLFFIQCRIYELFTARLELT